MSIAATRFNSSSKKSSPPVYVESVPKIPLTPREAYEDGNLSFVIRCIAFIAILATIDQINPHEIDETDYYNKDKKKGKWVTNTNWWLVPIIVFSILFGIDVLYKGYGAYVVYYLKPTAVV